MRIGKQIGKRDTINRQLLNGRAKKKSYQGVKRKLLNSDCERKILTIFCGNQETMSWDSI